MKGGLELCMWLTIIFLITVGYAATPVAIIYIVYQWVVIGVDFKSALWEGAVLCNIMIWLWWFGWSARLLMKEG